MKHFLDSNPGLKSRFKLYFEFPDYLPQELSRIADFACENKKVVPVLEAKRKIDDIILNAYRSRDRSFGNARFVYDIIEQAKINLGLRVMGHDNPRSLSNDEISIIELLDVAKIKVEPKRELPDIPIDQSLLDEALGELRALIGMTKVKSQIQEMVQLVRFYQISGKSVLNNFFLHTVFIGNPGTGKTTVARILTKIYKALGILERGHMVETDRQGLVAGFVGQTAIKTAEKIDEAMGGVLFVDEAYALTHSGPSAHGDFGNEAIQTLLKRMEDNRGQFFVFVAGYPDNMETFLKANPGLNSRFDKYLKFDDYTPLELSQIASSMLGEEGYQLSSEATVQLENYLQFIHEYRDKYFGNARSVRNVVTEIIKNQNLRLAALDQQQRDQEDLRLLLPADLANLKTDKSGFLFNKKTIGFNKSRGATN
ncbi:MAG: AAA family ATPase [Bacteroidota bacterium]